MLRLAGCKAVSISSRTRFGPVGSPCFVKSHEKNASRESLFQRRMWPCQPFYKTRDAIRCMPRSGGRRRKLGSGFQPTREDGRHRAAPTVCSSCDRKETVFQCSLDRRLLRNCFLTVFQNALLHANGRKDHLRFWKKSLMIRFPKALFQSDSSWRHL